MKIIATGRQLTIDGVKVDLEKKIQEAFEYKGRVIVLFDNEDESADDEFEDRNIVALDHNGRMLWRIGDSNLLFPATAPSIDPFVGIGPEESDEQVVLVAYEMFGMCYEVDEATGELSNPVDSR